MSHSTKQTNRWSTASSVWSLAFAIVFSLSGCSCAQTTTQGAVVNRSPAVEQSAPDEPKNIILFISDGCGPASFTFARDFVRTTTGRESLQVDRAQVGSVATFAANTLVTDSAAGATAFACGVKTDNGAIAVDTAGTPVETILERAMVGGKATGLVATSRITHATPAAFASHVLNRSNESAIADQMATSGVDLLLGGGQAFFLPGYAGGSRADSSNVLDVLKSNGTKVFTTLAELRSLNTTPAVGLFARDHMAYEIDRDPLSQPSLVEMTMKAIDLLKGDPDGFVIMVEGSRIDHAAHQNDAAAHLRDILAFDDAVGAALEFAEQDGNTLVVSVSDHETGGMTIGRAIDGRSYYNWKPEVVGRITASHDRMMNAYLVDSVAVTQVVQQYTGIADLSEDEVAALESTSNRYSLDALLGEIVGRRATIAWTSGGHTAVDVNLYAFGPGSERFVGHFDNTYVGITLLDLLR